MIVNGQPNQTAIRPVNKVIPRLDPEKATIQLINTIPAATRIKGDNYWVGGYWLLLWNFVCAAFIAWLFLFGGLSAYLQKRLEKIKKRGWRNLVYIILYFLLSFLLALPLDIYQNFIREQQYGFSNQNFIQWFSTDLLTFLVELIIAAPFFVLVYAVFRKVKVDIDQVYVYNESKQTKAFNANVTGFAGTGEIALNDNVLNQCTDNEITAILGHEMGHYVLNHLFILVLEFGLLIVIGFRLVKWLLNKLILKYGERWQVTSIHDITSLPLLVFLFTFYFFIITPISNSIIRTVEIEADNYGLNAAREPDAFVSVCLKTADNHKIAPGYWEEVFFYDHPSRKMRILAAMRWKAENMDAK